MTTARWGAFILVLAVTGALSFGFARAVSDSRRWREESEQALIDPTFLPTDPADFKQVPDFELRDRNGNPIRLSDFGAVEVLVINIWTTGCPACEAELPSLEEMDRRFGRGKVALVTITTNEKWSEVAHLFPRGTDLRILFDPEEKVTSGIFNTTRFPETFILDKQRRIRARFDGQRLWHSDEMLQYLATFK